MSAIKNLLSDIFILFDWGYTDEQVSNELDCPINMVNDARKLYAEVEDDRFNRFLR